MSAPPKFNRSADPYLPYAPLTLAQEDKRRTILRKEISQTAVD